MKDLSNNTNFFRGSNTITSTLVLGIFFLVWSINSYFFGGQLLKQFFILFGLGLILKSTLFSLPKGYLFYRFASISFILMLLYWGLAFLQNQGTTTFGILSFDLICYFLLLSGYLIAINKQEYTFTSSKVFYLIAFLVCFGTVMYLKYQTALSLNSISGSSRSATEGDDESINVIGIAYTNAIIFFVLYHYYTHYKLSSFRKVTVLISIFATLVIILTTQSRGALLFLLFIVFLNNLHRFNSITKIVKVIFYFIVVILTLIIIYIQLVDLYPVVGEKLDGSLNRFQLLLELANDSEADRSAYERTLWIGEFYKNIGSIILFGQTGYRPYPHNQIIEIIMRWGIFFGMPLLISSLFSFFKGLVLIVKKQVKNSVSYLIVLLFLFSFLQSLSSMSLEMNRMFWLGLGFLLGVKNLNKAS